MSTMLIFIRHGESEGNKGGRFNGSINFPLTDKGRAQAHKTAEYLDKYKIDKVYTSDLSRAKETAEIIAKRQNLDVIEDIALREINGGDFEGELYDDLSVKFPEEFKIWMTDLGNCQCPNGESIRDLLRRFNGKVLEIVENNKDKTVLIGTHAMPIRVMSTVWNKKDITDVRDIDYVKNASVTVIDYTDIDNPEIVEYDTADYLGELMTELPKNV
jgi:broad specificity phosphatase PhoE